MACLNEHIMCFCYNKCLYVGFKHKIVTDWPKLKQKYEFFHAHKKVHKALALQICSTRLRKRLKKIRSWYFFVWKHI